MSRMASSGTRTTRRRRFASGFTKAMIVTREGISCADGTEGSARTNAPASATARPLTEE